MADKVSDFLLERLRQWRIHRIFGFPGDGINGILAALYRAEGDPEFIQVRHEEMSAFMACGHAKFTGEVGVCLATSGPGAVHLLNGLYDARLDHQPVLAIVGQQPRTSIGGSFQQELDLHTLYKDVAGEYVNVISSPEQLPGALDRAIRIAKTQRTVTCLIFPKDVQEMDAVKQPPHEFHMYTGSVGYAAPRMRAPPEAVQRAADVLNAGRRVAMLIGQGAKGAATEVLEIADKLGAGIAKALLGKERAARYASLRHRLDWTVGHTAKLRHDDGLRHITDGRI